MGQQVGGYKIIKTIGTKIAKIKPYQGTAADLAGAICILISSLFGVPISTVQTKSTAIMGVGASKGLSKVNWKTAKNMLLTWIITFPGCGFLGYFTTFGFIGFFA